MSPNGDIEVLEVEVLIDVDKPNLKFVRFPGQRLAPMQDNSQPADRVTKLAPIKGRKTGRPQTSAYPDALPEPPPRRI